MIVDITGEVSDWAFMLGTAFCSMYCIYHMIMMGYVNEHGLILRNQYKKGAVFQVKNEYGSTTQYKINKVDEKQLIISFSAYSVYGKNLDGLLSSELSVHEFHALVKDSVRYS